MTPHGDGEGERARAIASVSQAHPAKARLPTRQTGAWIDRPLVFWAGSGSSAEGYVQAMADHASLIKRGDCPVSDFLRPSEI